MKRIAIATVVFAAATSPSPRLPAGTADWRGGPVKHLMTPADREQWAALSTEQQAQEFVDLFLGAARPVAGDAGKRAARRVRPARPSWPTSTSPPSGRAAR